jgi:heme exporter protein C
MTTPTRSFSISGYAAPGKITALLDALRAPFGIITLGLFALGFYFSFFNSPPDYQQGETVRIMYIHVPAAWMALFTYVTMATAAFCALIWRHVVAEEYMRAMAPVGAAFTAICLVTGALWGQPTWGTWWVWDARLTSVLVLFFLYLGYMALASAFDDEQKGLNAGAVLLLIGAVNIPIIKFSVDWWNTLHQPASILRADGPSIDASMLWPLIVMALAFKCLFIFLVTLRLPAALSSRRKRLAQLRGQAT